MREKNAALLAALAEIQDSGVRSGDLAGMLNMKTTARLLRSQSFTGEGKKICRDMEELLAEPYLLQG